MQPKNNGPKAPDPTIQVYGVTDEEGWTQEAYAKMREATKALERNLRTELKSLMATELAMALYSPTVQQKLRHIFEAFELMTDAEKEAILTPNKIAQARRYRELHASVNELTKLEHGKAFIPFTFPENDAPIYMDFFTQWYGQFGATNWDSYYVMLARYLKTGEAPIWLCYEVKCALINESLPFGLSVLRVIFEEYVGVAGEDLGDIFDMPSPPSSASSPAKQKATK